MKLSSLAAAVIVGTLAIAALPAPSALAQGTVKSLPGKIDLRPKWKVGQETRFKMEMDTSGTQNTPGAGEGTPLKQAMGATLLFRCKDTNPETGSTLEVTYESLKINLKSPLMNIDFDSSKPATNDPMDAVIRPILETKLSVKMDKDGNITSVDGGPGGMTEQFASADLMKNMFGPLFTTKKGTGAAAVGDTWTNEDTMDAGMGTVRITTTNTLKSLMGSLALIDINGKFSLDPSSGGKGVTIRDSSLKGEAKWDVESGMLETMQMKQKLTVEQTQADSPTPTRTTQDMNMKVTRLRTATPAGETPSKPDSAPKADPKDWGPVRK